MNDSMPQSMQRPFQVSFQAGLVMPALCLALFGLVMVSSATLAGSVESPSTLAVPLRHTFYLLAALAAFLVVAHVPLETWRVLRVPLMLLAIIMCAVVLVIGVNVNGATRWISLGPVSVQPIELVKWVAIVYVAASLSRHASPQGLPIKAYVQPIMLFAMLCGLLLLQPDFGGMVLLLLVVLAMTFLAGMRIHHLLAAGVAALAGLGTLAVSASYRLDRILSFMNPWESATGEGYQSVQAQIAFGRGEFFGLGLGDGVQKLAYLPESHNDFILAVVAEELGLFGILAVVVLFAFLIFHVLRVGRRVWCDNDPYPALLAWGVGLAIGLQALINYGVNLGVLPTKGLTLPLISYGGNSLIATAAMLGLVARVEMETDIEEAGDDD